MGIRYKIQHLGSTFSHHYHNQHFSIRLPILKHPLICFIRFLQQQCPLNTPHPLLRKQPPIPSSPSTLASTAMIAMVAHLLTGLPAGTAAIAATARCLTGTLAAAIAVTNTAEIALWNPRSHSAIVSSCFVLLSIQHRFEYLSSPVTYISALQSAHATSGNCRLSAARSYSICTRTSSFFHFFYSGCSCARLR